MTRTSKTLWVIGTSVSIEHGGYVDQLAALAIERGLSLRNLSVGDQTSVMGCMRVFAHRLEFQPGDVVVWEYSLLDHLLSQGQFSADDIIEARRMAWRELAERGVDIIALMCAPREAIAERTTAESQMARDAAEMDIRCIDIRDLFRELLIEVPADHYRDDRHPYVDSPVVALLAARLMLTAGSVKHGQRLMSQSSVANPWVWVDLSAIASAGRPSEEFSNSLMTVTACPLAVDEALQLPFTRRVVALGLVSTHEAGAIWCGHPECPPASARLPAELNYSFLLRATGIPCTRASIERLVSAPDWAFRNGSWCAYGQAKTELPGPIAVFGALVESFRSCEPTNKQERRETSRLNLAKGWFKHRRS